jgi:hypothetical protein
MSAFGTELPIKPSNGLPESRPWNFAIKSIIQIAI